MIAVVKANAYGHGAPEVGLALEEAGAAMLACADIEEGIVLRRRRRARADPRSSARSSVSDLDGVFTHRPDADDLDALRRARAPGRPPRNATMTLRCHLKIDTGMNRLGFRHDNLARTLPEVAASANLADRRRLHALRDRRRTRAPGVRRAARAIRRGVRARCRRSASRLDSRHAANSAALLRDERVWHDFVRPGLLLYGIVPPPLAATLPLRPALSLHSRIVHVKGLRPGEGIGLRPARGRRPSRDDRRRPRRLRRRPRSPHGGPGVHARARPPRARRRLGVHGHDDDRRDGHGRRARRRGRHRRRSRARRRSACARSPRRSGRFPTSCCVASAARIQRVYE